MEAKLMQNIGSQAAQSAASSAAGSAAGTIFGRLDEWLFGNSDRKKQLKQQQALTNQQVAANKELNDYNKQNEFDLWNKTNYEAQIAHMKNAGLNPALMYGQAGSGVTGSSSQSAGAGQAANEAQMQQAQAAKMGMALQIGMQKAQIDNINADTEQKKATTQKTAGVDTELQLANISNITEDTQNKRIQRLSLNLDNEFNDIRNDIAAATKDVSINNIKNNAAYLKTQLDILINQRDISDETKNNIIKSYEMNLKNIATDILLKNSGIELNRANAQKAIESIAQQWKDLDLKKEQININKFTEEWKANNPSMSNISGGVLSNIISWLSQGMPMKGLKPAYNID